MKECSFERWVCVVIVRTFTTIIIVGPFLHNAPITLIKRICSSSPLSQSIFLTPCLDPRHNVPKGFLLHFLRLTPLADTTWKRKDHGRKWSRRQLQKRLCIFRIKYGDMIMNYWRFCPRNFQGTPWIWREQTTVSRCFLWVCCYSTIYIHLYNNFMKPYESATINCGYL